MWTAGPTRCCPTPWRQAAPPICSTTSRSIKPAVSRAALAAGGDTVGAIAGEKAGIIKRGVPVIVGPQSEEGLAVIEAWGVLH